MRDSLSSSIADMFFLEQVLDKRRLLLAPMQMAAQGGHHLSSVGRSALAQGVGLDVLVEQLIGIKLRAAYSTQIDHRFHGDCDQSFHSKAISGSTSKRSVIRCPAVREDGRYSAVSV